MSHATRATLIQRLAGALGIPEEEAAKFFGLTLPVILIDDITRPQDTDVFNERLCSGFGSRAAVVGERASVQLLNPAGSGMLATLGLVGVGLDVAADVAFRRHNAAIADLSGTPGFRDLRLAGNPVLEVRNASDVTPVGTVGVGPEVQLADSGSQFIQLDWILPPGQSAIAVATNTNKTLRVSWWWIERRV